MAMFFNSTHKGASMEFSLAAKCNARFIKISQLESDIRSCRCKNFSPEQATGLIGGPDPPDYPPLPTGFSTEGLKFHGSSGYKLVCYTAASGEERCVTTLITAV